MVDTEVSVKRSLPNDQLDDSGQVNDGSTSSQPPRIVPPADPPLTPEQERARREDAVSNATTSRWHEGDSVSHKTTVTPRSKVGPARRLWSGDKVLVDKPSK